MRALVLLVAVGLLAGCSRSYYRKGADRETYHALGEHNTEPSWAAPHTSIDPPPASRLFDPYCPDRPPLPPDDPAAHTYLHRVDGIKGYKKWHKDGDAAFIEYPGWREALPLSDKGDLLLTPDLSVELGLLHSREYQTTLEDLYTTALTLTFNRFEFACRWFARNNTMFTHFGSGSANNEQNTLTTSSNAGFTRNLATGGQLMVDFANSFVFEFAGLDRTTTTSNIVVNFIQPLLRMAGREVRLESLTQAERNVLYAVRDFARFRKQFTFNITTGGQGYLGLLFQLQNIRNQEANLVALEQNLRLHEALYPSGTVSLVQVDQVFQQYQQGRAALIRQRADLESSLDGYKTLLGLPPELATRLDDSLLGPFQLTDPGLETLQKELDRFFAEFIAPDQPPPLPKLQDGMARLKAFHGRTVKVIDQIEGELERWQKQLDEPEPDEAQAQRTRNAFRDLAKEIPELREEVNDLGKGIDTGTAALAGDKLQEGWERLLRRIQEEVALAGQLYVLQTQVRVYLIRLDPVKWQLDPAVQYARDNRLDLMNQRARVVDAWRQITVTADALEPDLNLMFNMNLATKPGGSNPVDFRAAASSYKVGVQFEAPLTRLAERNAYRTSLIGYQRARRSFMALDDTVQRSIRRDLRNLEAERLNFEIARQSLISAARQVEGAREQLRLVTQAAETNTTQNILTALNAVLAAKTQLISSWVSYETGRMQLLLDLEALQLDERGLPVGNAGKAPVADGDKAKAE